MVKEEISAWRENILRLDDKKFFMLMRLYLGELKTPYNKQRLLDSLESFLRREETQKNMLALLSDLDLEILRAVKFIPNATPKKLQDFFRAESFCENIEEMLGGLQSRLLLYDCAERLGRPRALKINPFLRGALDGLLTLDGLLPECEAREKPFAADCAHAELAAAFLSFVAKNPGICKMDGTFKKRAEAEMEERFPGRLEKIRLLKNALEHLLIIKENDGALEVDWERARAFSELDSLSQAMLLLSCVSARYGEGQTRFYAQVFFDALSSVPQNGFAEKIFLRSAYLISARESGAEEGAFAQSRFARIVQSYRQNEESARGASLQEIFGRMLEEAEALGFVLTAQDDGGQKIVFKNPRFFEERALPKNIAMINVDSGFGLTMMPGFGLSRALAVALFCDLLRFDTVVQFEINQSSAIRAFDAGIGADDILSALKEYSHFDAPAALKFSLKEWEADCKAVSVYKGFVLKADPKRSEALLQNPHLKKKIAERLAPNVFLLDCKNEAEVLALLKACGRERFGKIKSAGESAARALFVPLKTRRPLFAEEQNSYEEKPPAKTAGRDEACEKRLQKMYSEIEALDLDDEQKDVLRNIASAKIIVNSSQFCAPAIPLEKNSAQGMDYEGKLRVIEKAMKEDERIMFRLSKKSRLLTGVPIGIDRTQFEDGMYLNVLVDGEQKEFSIGKIEFAQRVQKLSIW